MQKYESESNESQPRNLDVESLIRIALAAKSYAHPLHNYSKTNSSTVTMESGDSSWDAVRRVCRVLVSERLYGEECEESDKWSMLKSPPTDGLHPITTVKTIPSVSVVENTLSWAAFDYPLPVSLLGAGEDDEPDFDSQLGTTEHSVDVLVNPSPSNYNSVKTALYIRNPDMPAPTPDILPGQIWQRISSL
jgi:hypothetical protein